MEETLMGTLSRIKDLQNQYNEAAHLYRTPNMKPAAKKALDIEMTRLLKALQTKIFNLRNRVLAKIWEVRFMNRTREYKAKIRITGLTQEEAELFLREYFRVTSNEIIEILEIKEIPTFEKEV